MTAPLAEFLLDRISERPVPERIALYRALAIETKDKELAADCRSIANMLEDIERNHLQLVLDFKRRQS